MTYWLFNSERNLFAHVLEISYSRVIRMPASHFGQFA